MNLRCVTAMGVSACLAASSVACSNPEKERLKETTQLTYDKQTGKLSRITADLNKNGRVDAWTYMDGAMPLRTEQDTDEDGKIDRWEFVSAGGKVRKVALAHQGREKPDTWMELDDQSRPIRIDYSPSGDENRPTRREHFREGVLVRVEEDTNHDGRPDKWEAHDGPAITAVEFDENWDGRPDRRMTFGPGGQVLSIETQPDGKGRYSRRVVPGGS